MPDISGLINRRVPEWQFSYTVEEYVKKRQRTDTHVVNRRIGRYYPSELPWCLRRTYYNFTNRRSFPVEKLAFFKTGDAFHDFVRMVLDDAGILVMSEMPILVIDPEWDIEISGRLDDVLLMDTNAGLAVVEAKSLGFGGINRRQQPEERNILQMTPYMRSVSTHAGYLVYGERNDYSKTITHTIFYEKKVLQRLIKRARIIHGCLVTEKVPPPEAQVITKEPWQCEGCLYADLCAQDPFDPKDI